MKLGFGLLLVTAIAVLAGLKTLAFVAALGALALLLAGFGVGIALGVFDSES